MSTHCHTGVSSCRGLALAPFGPHTFFCLLFSLYILPSPSPLFSLRRPPLFPLYLFSSSCHISYLTKPLRGKFQTPRHLTLNVSAFYHSENKNYLRKLTLKVGRYVLTMVSEVEIFVGLVLLLCAPSETGHHDRNLVVNAYFIVKKKKPETRGGDPTIPSFFKDNSAMTHLLTQGPNSYRAHSLPTAPLHAGFWETLKIQTIALNTSTSISNVKLPSLSSV